MNEEQCVPTMAPSDLTVGCESRKEEPTMQRYLELTQLAVRACQELETHGLKKTEYYLFGRIIEQVCRLK